MSFCLGGKHATPERSKPSLGARSATHPAMDVASSSPAASAAAFVVDPAAIALQSSGRERRLASTAGRRNAPCGRSCPS